ncbi:hypothetical protein ES708_07591 [subsurface metagenome]
MRVNFYKLETVRVEGIPIARRIVRGERRPVADMVPGDNSGGSSY